MCKVILKGKTGIVLIIMMISEEVYAVESNLTTTLQPTLTVLLPSFAREDGDEHALTEK